MYSAHTQGVVVKKELKTPEDFEKVFKALEDPTASPGEYTVVGSLGYCENCTDVTEYVYVHEDYADDYIYCKECRATFDMNSYRFPYAGRHPRTGATIHYICREQSFRGLMPSSAWEKLEYMRSREGQRHALEDMLIERYKKTKEEREELLRKHWAKESEEHEYFMLHGRYVTQAAVERNS